MKIVLEENAFMPVREHATDAGLDLRAMESCIVNAGGHALCRTGVHVQLPEGTCGVLVSKSGLNVKHDITSTGLIDEGYTGEIMVKLYNHGSHDFYIRAGEKISQLVIVPCRYEPIEVVDVLEDSDRGDKGFGSTGR